MIIMQFEQNSQNNNSQNITGRNDNNILDNDTIRIVIDDKHNIKNR